MDNELLSEKARIALNMNATEGDGNALIVDMSGKTSEDVKRDMMIRKANKEMEVYAEAFNKHTEALQEATEQLALKPEDVEIMPIGNYILVKPFKTNPFQRIVRNESGLITDIGGMAPVFKNTDSGEFQQEEEFVLTGAVQEIGPDCKYLKPGDAVFFTKPSMVPVPFYRSGLMLVNETRILAVVNEGLTKRFEALKKNN